MVRGWVYCVTCKVNGKVYVGQTIKSVRSRWRDHLKAMERNDTKFYHAINKYGEDQFEVSILEEVVCIDKFELKAKLNEKERFWIEFLNSKKNGYNSTTGGDGVVGYNHSEETKERLRQIAKTQILHENMIKAQKKKGCVAWNKGVEFSAEVRNKMTKSHLGKTSWNKGKKCDENHRKNLSKAHKGKKCVIRRCPILQIDKDGNIVEYPSIRALRDVVKINKKAIQNV